MIRLIFYGIVLLAMAFMSSNPFQSVIVMIMLYILGELILINDKISKK